MSDILLGAIIGGAIAVAGSAVAGWIQGYYSMKGKREENLNRQQQQATDIQHGKDSLLLSRRIGVRSRYLEPLTSHLGELYTCLSDYEEKLIDVLRQHYTDSRTSDKIRVAEVDKEEFARQLQEITTTFKRIGTPQEKAVEFGIRGGDSRLLVNVSELMAESVDLAQKHTEMRRSLRDSAKGEDFAYDFEAIMKSMRAMKAHIGAVHRRIESLLAGVEEADE